MPQKISKVVHLDINDVIALDLEGFLDLLEEKAGHGVLEDISYKVVGSTNGEIDVLVEAYPSIID